MCATALLSAPFAKDRLHNVIGKQKNNVFAQNEAFRLDEIRLAGLDWLGQVVSDRSGWMHILNFFSKCAVLLDETPTFC